MDEWQKNGGYVTSAREVLEVIADFEFQTDSKFSVFRQENLYGKENLDFKKISKFEVRWIDSQANALPHISFDGVPFIILGKKKWDCHQGKQRNKKNIEKNKQKRLNKEDHDFKRRRKEVQTSKKLACPLQIRVRHIVKFPDFKIENIVADDKHKREALSKSLKRALEETQDFTIQHRYYVLLPNEEHQNHLVGEAGCLVQPVGETVKKFIHSTVFEQNVTSTKEMRLLVEMHVRQHFNGTTLPPKTNKRFWPSIKDLQNHIAFALRKQRNSTLDQAVVKDLVKKWQEENAKDSFFLRLKEDVDEGNDHHDSCIDFTTDNFEDEVRFGDQLASALYGNQNRFLFVYQSGAQKRLLNRYGNDICLMDATYRTTKYALPLYFICVPTNVNYMVVAMFILETEDSHSIMEALSVIKEWNPTWKPTYFMCDHAEEEIRALETIFPESFGYLCDFHREQSWDRWLTASHNGVSQSKANIIELFRKIASSMTEEEYEVAKNALMASNHWTENKRLQTWFENTWLKKHKRWVKAYRQCVFNVLVNTNNGVERQNKALKYEYLDMKKTKSLSQLLSTILTKYFPDSDIRYLRLNVAASELSRSYGGNIPEFLKNRPRQIIDHCYPRWEDSANISSNDIDELAEGKFLVKSQNTNNESLTYLVEFKQSNSEMPHCDCMDWKRSHLVCKHFMAVFRHTEFKWDRLSEVYRENPILNLDLEHINIGNQTHMGEEIISCNDNVEVFENEDQPVADLPLSSAAKIKSHRSKIVNLCQLMREWVYHCSDSNVLSSVEKELSSLVLTLKTATPRDGEFVIDSNPMTHIAGSKVKKQTKSFKKLPSRSRKRKSSGRVGVRAEKTRKMQTRKGVEKLCSEYDSKERYIVVEDVDNICHTQEFIQGQNKDNDRSDDMYEGAGLAPLLSLVQDFWSNIKNKEASDLLQEAKQTHQLTLDDSSLVGSAVMELFCKEEAAEAYISLTETFPKSLNGSQKYRLLNLILAKLVESKVIKLPKDPSKNPLLRKNLITEAMEDLLKAVEGDSLSKTKKVTWSDGFETGDTCIDIDEQKARNKVNKIWDSDLASKYFIAKVYGTVVTYGDISSLKNGEWLTDKVMDAYLGYIAQVEMDRGRLKVRREVVSTVNNIVNGKYVPGRHERNKIMPYDFIIGAYHQRGGHWDLLIIEPPKARVVFLNPMGETLYQTRTVLLNWRKYIGQILVLHPEDNITRNWTLHTPDHSKQQDGSSCGIFCLMFAEKYIQGEALEGITQTRANFKRREVANTLLLFEGHMDGCCPCCGFNTRQGQEPLVKCRMCAKYFHMKNHCVGNITSEDATFICEICSRS